MRIRSLPLSSALRHLLTASIADRESLRTVAASRELGFGKAGHGNRSRVKPFTVEEHCECANVIANLAAGTAIRVGDTTARWHCHPIIDMEACTAAIRSNGDGVRCVRAVEADEGIGDA